MPHPIYRIFISSTLLDLAPERKSVEQAVTDLNSAVARAGIALHAIDLRRGSAPEPPLEVCLQEVRLSDVVITLVGKCYGSETDAGLSYSETEFDEATTQKLNRLAFYKDESAVFLPEHVDTDPEKVHKLAAFREKIDGQLKRETFLNSDELRADVIRDLMRWLIGQPQVAATMARKSPVTFFAGGKRYFDAVNQADYESAADVVLSREFTLDMQRHGLGLVHQAMLADLLGIGGRSSSGQIADLKLRARLLLRFVAGSRGTLSGSVALEEALRLQNLINDAHYSFEVAKEQVRSTIESNRYDLAKLLLKRMMKCADKTGDLHALAQAQEPFGDFYRAQGNHKKALKWYWKEIETICKMPDMCPFCLSDAFRLAGNELMSLGKCILANDRFGKSLAIARIIPSRVREIQALHFIAKHFAHHGSVREGIAAYVWLARLSAESDPSSEGANLNLLLGELSVRHGRDLIKAHLKEVEARAEQVVDEALAPYQLDKFVRKLDIKPSSAGDHW
jgi:tetratricopeptide (TPR) repeat protein